MHPVNTLGKNAGKANKLGLLVPIIQAELAKEEVLDRKKVVLIGQKRLAEYPPELRAGVEITQKDVSKALRELKRGHKVALGPATAPGEQPPSVVSYTATDLLNAKRFLRECGHSLTKARSLLDLVSSLLQGD